MKNEHLYRIPLRYFPGLRKINFPTKISYRLKCHLKTEMKKLFQSRKVYASGTALKTSRSYSQKHHSFNMNKYYLIRTLDYLETIMVSKKKFNNWGSKNTMQKNRK